MKRYYAVKAYGFSTFPSFHDSFPTFVMARKTAQALIKDGWRFAEVMRDDPRKPGYFGIERTIVETHGVEA